MLRAPPFLRPFLLEKRTRSTPSKRLKWRNDKTSWSRPWIGSVLCRWTRAQENFPALLRTFLTKRRQKWRSTEKTTSSQKLESSHYQERHWDGRNRRHRNRHHQRSTLPEPCMQANFMSSVKILVSLKERYRTAVDYWLYRIIHKWKT